MSIKFFQKENLLQILKNDLFVKKSSRSLGIMKERKILIKLSEVFQSFINSKVHFIRAKINVSIQKFFYLHKMSFFDDKINFF
jgi:hypothetical protein